MKTIALLFAAVSFTACATDDGREVDAIDKDSDSRTEIDKLDGAAGEWAEQFIGDPRKKVDGVIDQDVTDWLKEKLPSSRFPGLEGGGSEWLQELINDQRTVAGIDDALVEQVKGLIRAPRGVEQLDDKLSEIVRAPHSVSEFEDKLTDAVEQIIREPHSIDTIDDKVKLVETQSRDVEDLDNHTGEWAEEILVNDRLYTLLHGPLGSHYLIDAVDGSAIVINGPIGPRR